MRRRTLLASATAMLATGSGCAALADEPTPAHTVSVYLADREATRDVAVTVATSDGTTIFEREYQLSDGNEADEDATFPASTEPETVVVTVDGNRFERQWPDVTAPELPCGDPNRAGVEVYVRGAPGEAPAVRLEANCQRVTMQLR